MRMRNLGILIAVAAAAVACGEATESADAGTQTFSEAAGELAADVSAGGDAATQEATDAEKKEAADAAAAVEEGIQTE
jgi:hypothetical protein